MKKGEATRARILDKAVLLASRDGLDGLSIGTLAGELKLSKAGLFAHFGSKETLQTAVLEHAAMLSQRRVIAPLTAVAAGGAQIQALLERCIAWIDTPSFPGGCPIISACFSLAPRSGQPWKVLVAMQRGFLARIGAMFGTFAAPDADLHQLAFEFRAITLGYQLSSRVLGERGAKAAARRALTALLARAGQKKGASQKAGAPSITARRAGSAR
jgi:AcrR family transcriptional regulator